MKVWQKIILGKYYDTKAWNLDTVESELAMHNCPATIEAKYRFIGDSKLDRHCNAGCGVKCLREYLDYEVKG